MRFQEKIVRIRKEKGLSQEELAEKLGVSRQAVAKWEAGLSYPDVDNLITLSNMFQVSIDSMLRPEEDSCSYNQSREKEPLTPDIIVFLCKAKKECYAGQGNRVESCRPETYDYRYAQGDYVYLDSYYGGEKFIGEEVLYVKGTPIFAMNYVGRELGEGFQGSFLKEALLRVPEDKPFRGPNVYRNGDYSYHCIIQGGVEWFQGYEEIFLLNRKVYECHFHGGMIR